MFEAERTWQELQTDFGKLDVSLATRMTSLQNFTV